MKEQLVIITEPGIFLKKIADKAVEWVLDFIITNPPSPLFKLLARFAQQITGKPLIQLLREKFKAADKAIDAIAGSATVQKLISPLKAPVTGILATVDSVSVKAGAFIDNMETRVLTFMSNGSEFLKQLMGHTGAPATAATESKTDDAGEGDFLGSVKSGIHSRLMTIGTQKLAQKGTAIGKAALAKGKEKVKGLLIGAKIGFTAGKEQHELWVEQQGNEKIVYLASEPRPLEARITQFENALPDVKDDKKRQEIKENIEELKKLNIRTKTAGLSETQKYEYNMTKVIENLFGKLNPLNAELTPLSGNPEKDMASVKDGALMDLTDFMNPPGQKMKIDPALKPPKDAKGRNNLERAKDGRTCFLNDKEYIELHHRNQNFFGPLDEHSHSYHQGSLDDPDMHPESQDVAYASWRDLPAWHRGKSSRIVSLGYVYNLVRPKYWRRRFE